MNKRAAPLFLLAVVFLLMASSLTWWAPRAKAQTSGNIGATRRSVINVDRSGNLYLMMSVATAFASEGRPHSQIFFAMSRDGGKTWNNLPRTRNLSKSSGEAFGPSVAIDKNSKKPPIYIVYEYSSNAATQVYLIRSPKKTKFQRPRNIMPGDEGAFSPRIALDSNAALYVVCYSTTGGGRQVVFVRSSDQGATFSEPLILSGGSNMAFDPEIAIDSSNNIYVAWEDASSGVSAIMFSYSTDGGQTFSDPKRISTGQGSATEVYIAADTAGVIHVTWVDESVGSPQAFYSRSIDGGQTFSNPINVSNEPGDEIREPFLAAFRNTVYIAFQMNKQVYLVKSGDGGVSFSKPVQVSQANKSRGRAHSPAMAIDGNNRLHIIFIDTSILGNDEGLLFYRNTKNGSDFSTQQVILAAIG